MQIRHPSQLSGFPDSRPNEKHLPCFQIILKFICIGEISGDYCTLLPSDPFHEQSSGCVPNDRISIIVNSNYPQKGPGSFSVNCQGFLFLKYLMFPADPLSDNILPIHAILQDAKNSYLSSTLIHHFIFHQSLSTLPLSSALCQPPYHE